MNQNISAKPAASHRLLLEVLGQVRRPILLYFVSEVVLRDICPDPRLSSLINSLTNTLVGKRSVFTCILSYFEEYFVESAVCLEEPRRNRMDRLTVWKYNLSLENWQGATSVVEHSTLSIPNWLPARVWNTWIGWYTPKIHQAHLKNRSLSPPVWICKAK